MNRKGRKIKKETKYSDFKKDLSAATGVFLAASAIGATVLPFIVAAANDLIGIRYGIGFSAVYLLLIIPLILAASKMRGRKEQESRE